MAGKKGIIESALKEHYEALKELAETESLQKVCFCAKKMAECIKKGKKILVFGNGGSAADAQHLEAELIGKLGKERMPLPAIAMSSSLPTTTAIANDFGFEEVFSRQIKALARKGDVVIAISTSGLSKNVINGVIAAKKIGAYTIAITSKRGKLKEMVDCAIGINSKNTQRIQEMHILVIHILCALVEEELCKKSSKKT
ncbi:MAG: SIS domain-containing protein [Candidatus Diapherotrites archaeon]